MKRYIGKTAAAIGLITVASVVYYVLYRITLYGADLSRLLKRKKQSAGNSCRRFCDRDDDIVYAYKIEFTV